jgi:hypothetical protein
MRDVTDRLAGLRPGVRGDHLRQFGQESRYLAGAGNGRVKLGLPAADLRACRLEQLAAALRLLQAGCSQSLFEPAKELPGALERLRGRLPRGLLLLDFGLRHRSDLLG